MTQKIEENRTLIDKLSTNADTQSQLISANATAISSNAEAILQNAENITKNAGDIETCNQLIAANLSLIEQNQKAIETNAGRLKDLDGQVSSNVTAIAKNAENIAQNAALISTNATAISNNAAAITQNASDILALQSSLTQAKQELTEAYTSAISTAISTLDGKLSAQMATEINAAITSLDQKVQTDLNALKNRVKSLEGEVTGIHNQISDILADIEGIHASIAELLARIQSVTVIPTVSDGSVAVNRYYNDINFEIFPLSVAQKLPEVGLDCFSMKAAETVLTKAVGDFTTMPISNIKYKDGIVTVTASCANIDSGFFKSEFGESARLLIEYGSINITSGYFSLSPTISSGDIDKDTPITLEFIEGGVLKFSNPYNNEIRYKKNDGNWETMSEGNSTIDVVSGDIIVLLGDNDSIGGSDGPLNIFSSAKYYAYGNIMSLVDSKYYPILTEITWPNGFYSLFKSGIINGLCSHPTKKLCLPATKLCDNYCYSGMFYNCQYLTTAPDLPATELGTYGCYAQMFGNCYLLENVPEILPAQTLSESCYEGMFANCTSLKKAPKLPAKELVKECYAGMFQGCSSLQYIEALFETDPNSKYSNNWVSGVSPSGTFVKGSTATWNVVGNNGIPSGWTVQTSGNIQEESNGASDEIPQMVDLGLSVKWASCNLGASKPEELGDYYAWGETQTKTTFSWTNYRFSPNGNSYSFSKYVVPRWDGDVIYGNPDYNNVLDPEDDAATVLLGEGWRIPTNEDFLELCDNCTWTPDEQDGVLGYRVTSNISGYTNRSIFIPADVNMYGDGIYWMSILCCQIYGKTNDCVSAGTFDVIHRSHDSEYPFSYGFQACRSRENGFLIRPVYGSPAKDKVFGISLNVSTLTLHPGETAQLKATILPADAFYESITWTAINDKVSVSNDGLVTAIQTGTSSVTAKVGDISYSCSIHIEAASTPANCHIMSTGGELYFPATRGNSSQSIEKISSICVLWESFNTDTQPAVGAVVSTIELAGSIIHVVAGSHEGNAVVAAKDKNDNILWSWHIWVTNDTIQEVTYRNNAGIMMDRNLGSIKLQSGSFDSGLLYQWGRKDPFLSRCWDHYGSIASTIAWPEEVAKSTGGTIEFSIQHPTTLVYISKSQNETSYRGDWLNNSDNTLWGEEKTIYDPCPSGWKLPKGGLTGIWAKAGFPSESISFNDYSGGTYYQPTYGDSQEYGSGLYWSYLTSDSAKAYSLYFSWVWSDDGDADYRGSNSNHTDYKAELGAVRCQRE